MSQKSKELIMALQYIVSKSMKDEQLNEDEIDEFARIFDNVLGAEIDLKITSKQTSETSSTTKSDTQKKTQKAKPESGVCEFKLTKVRPGEPCGGKCTKDSKFCARHSKKSLESTPSKDAAQDAVKTEVKPDFSFGGKKFTSVKPGDSIKKVEPISDSQPRGIFSARAAQSLASKKKPHFFNRKYYDDTERVEYDFIFTTDELMKNFVFVDNDGERILYAVLHEGVIINEDQELLPEDFSDMVDVSFRDRMDDRHRNWCVTNKISFDVVDEDDN